ncbi:unnamed protein product [Vitrella brassicaformis CCMP3155]|uniref:Protein kinase domain-containing protein n=2 Tax=Vitrella brassicaformis TaxID=1169539 RepID=A0A0G4E8B7_VITBC|nr:unnamed protein product [Vitrella brassicaformis CCMP3155]|eukprot:CEL91919.1 unnamed protein product [Vitrella brassicaformis CCMP3155]
MQQPTNRRVTRVESPAPQMGQQGGNRPGAAELQRRHVCGTRPRATTPQAPNRAPTFTRMHDKAPCRRPVRGMSPLPLHEQRRPLFLQAKPPQLPGRHTLKPMQYRNPSPVPNYANRTPIRRRQHEIDDADRAMMGTGRGRMEGVGTLEVDVGVMTSPRFGSPPERKKAPGIAAPPPLAIPPMGYIPTVTDKAKTKKKQQPKTHSKAPSPSPIGPTTPKRSPYAEVPQRRKTKARSEQLPDEPKQLGFTRDGRKGTFRGYEAHNMTPMTPAKVLATEVPVRTMHKPYVVTERVPFNPVMRMVREEETTGVPPEVELEMADDEESHYLDRPEEEESLLANQEEIVDPQVPEDTSTGTAIHHLDENATQHQHQHQQEQEPAPLPQLRFRNWLEPARTQAHQDHRPLTPVVERETLAEAQPAVRAGAGAGAGRRERPVVEMDVPTNPWQAKERVNRAEKEKEKEKDKRAIALPPRKTEHVLGIYGKAAEIRDARRDAQQVRAKVALGARLTARPNTGERAADDSERERERPSREEELEICEKVGSGAYAKVHRARNRVTRESVALKMYPRSHYQGRKRQSYEREENVLRMVRDLVKHPHIVGYIGPYETRTHLCFVFEFLEGGNLKHWVDRKGGRLTEADARAVFSQLVDALEALHRNNIVHRDIKLDNILRDKKSSYGNSHQVPFFKLIDFGFSFHVREDHSGQLKLFCGTPSYMAPEIVTNQRTKQAFCGFKADVWAMGVVLYHLVCGQLPFRAENDSALYQKILHSSSHLKVPDRLQLTPTCEDIIRRMLHHDPRHRLSMHEAKHHEWLRGEASVSTAIPSSQSSSMRSNLNTINSHPQSRPNSLPPPPNMPNIFMPPCPPPPYTYLHPPPYYSPNSVPHTFAQAAGVAYFGGMLTGDGGMAVAPPPPTFEHHQGQH